MAPGRARGILVREMLVPEYIQEHITSVIRGSTL
jgi:hypothetical protein